MPRTGEGTGIVFNDFDTPALEWALNTALDLYAQPAHWTRLMRNGMAATSPGRASGESSAIVPELERRLAARSPTAA